MFLLAGTILIKLYQNELLSKYNVIFSVQCNPK